MAFHCPLRFFLWQNACFYQFLPQPLIPIGRGKQTAIEGSTPTLWSDGNGGLWPQGMWPRLRVGRLLEVEGVGAEALIAEA